MYEKNDSVVAKYQWGWVASLGLAVCSGLVLGCQPSDPATNAEGDETGATGPMEDDGSPTSEDEVGEEPVCGNGVLELGEQCDDGNDVNSDGCNVDCVVSGSLVWELELDVVATAIDAQGTIHALGPTADGAGVALYRVSPEGALLSQQTPPGPAPLPAGTVEAIPKQLRIAAGGAPAHASSFALLDSMGGYVDSVDRVEVVDAWVADDDFSVHDFDTFDDGSLVAIGQYEPGQKHLRRYAADGSITLEVPVALSGVVRALPDGGLLVGGGDVARFDADGGEVWLAPQDSVAFGADVIAGGAFVTAGHRGEVFARQVELTRWSANGELEQSALWPDAPTDLRVFDATTDASGRTVVAVSGQIASFGPDGALSWVREMEFGAFDVTLDEQGAAIVVSHDRLSKLAP